MFRLLAFGPSITRNTITRILTLHHGDLCKAQRWNNSVLTFDRSRPYSLQPFRYRLKYLLVSNTVI